MFLAIILFSIKYKKFKEGRIANGFFPRVPLIFILPNTFATITRTLAWTIISAATRTTA